MGRQGVHGAVALGGKKQDPEVLGKKLCEDCEVRPLPLPCVPTAFVAKTLPFLAVLRFSRPASACRCASQRCCPNASTLSSAPQTVWRPRCRDRVVARSRWRTWSPRALEVHVHDTCPWHVSMKTTFAALWLMETRLSLHALLDFNAVVQHVLNHCPNHAGGEEAAMVRRLRGDAPRRGIHPARLTDSRPLCGLHGRREEGPAGLFTTLPCR